MMRRISARRPRLAFLTILFTLPSLVWSAEKVDVEWRFDKNGDARGWAAGGHIRESRVLDGALLGETSDWDPIILGPTFEVEATPTQCVEFKMRTPRGGTGQLFWTETTDGKYGGFSQQKSSAFTTESGDDFRVYRVFPFWHAAGKIIRLRLDPPATGTFAIEWIRVVDLGAPANTAAQSWRFDSGTHGWRAWQLVSDPSIVGNQLRVTTKGNSPIIMSPPLAIAADRHPFVSIRMAVQRGTSGRVFCVSNKRSGWEDIAFPLRADGHIHSYNIDVGHLDSWCDQIIMLGVQPSNVEGDEIEIESIEIAESPRGPAELRIGYFGPTEGLLRAGRHTDINLSLQNLGGELAQNINATLMVPENVRILGPARQTIDRLTHWLPKTVTWQVESQQPGRVELAIRLSSSDAQPMSTTTTVQFTRAPQIPLTTYIPDPQPVRSPYDIGAFYFPGWQSQSRWQPILDYPMRKPILGWYDEANPECADWQIKWAVEHGVTFFMVDWYWCDGNRHLEHWLHDAFMKARFRKYLKWAVMWANHNPPDTHSLEDWRKVTQYWIDHYFGMKEYYRIDGRPAVFLWAPAGIRNDVGSSQHAAKLYALSQQMARDAGLPGIYFVAMSSHQSEAACKQLKEEGYEAFTSYHAFQLAAQRAGSKRFPFADVVSTSPQVWREADERASGLTYFPIVDTGWSSEPWHGDKSLVISDRTPDQFGKLCRAARDYADQTDQKIIAVGPWNEWGEGSYIEPYAEFGFDDLDQLRAAFCPPGDWPPNLIPSDVGRGPYDLPKLEPKSAWQFNNDGDLEGWTPNGYLNAEVKDGLLVGEATGPDPVLQGPGIKIEADHIQRLTIRMRTDSHDHAQLFWSTATSSIGEGNSLRFKLDGDGQFHEYVLDLAKSPQWRGLITSLRFDPSSKSQSKFAIDAIRF